MKVLKFLRYFICCSLALVLGSIGENCYASDLAASNVQAADAPGSFEIPGWLSLHIQGTATDQAHPSFHSTIPDAPQSMKSRVQSAETVDATLFMGIRAGNFEFYANPEMDQGFGLSNTFGVAGFPSGEAYKVGQHTPYFQLPRLFGRTTIDRGGERHNMDDAANQVATAHDANNVTLTFGKFSAVDIFDTNAYAHDPRADFFNWAIIDMGAFDYAANAWGYSYGGAVEWNQDWWTLRGGIFDLSRQPNDKYLVRGFDRYQAITEAEERHSIHGMPGKFRILFFLSAAPMGTYADALALAQQTANTPSTALVRRYQMRPGGGVNLEQQMTPDLGTFLRAGMNDGTKETYEFTEINRSVSGGLSLKGSNWDRPDDTIGLAGAVNGISKEARAYLAAGGQGILIGDGQLPSYSAEKIIEAYYKLAIVPSVAMTADYQRAINPAYDAGRGPINFYGLRLHAEY